MNKIHYEIFSRSLKVLSKKLRRNIYSLDSLSYPMEQVQLPDPDPLAALRYPCLYWVDHLYESEPHNHANMKIGLQDRDLVDVFITKKYLYWLEALSLCKGMAKGVLAMAKLEKCIQGEEAANLAKLVYDARRFIMYHKHAIETSPLQAYGSALLFSPSSSLIRRHFLEEQPDWITIKRQIGTQWSTCLQTLEGHSDTVNCAVFSDDLTRLASASDDCTLKIWDAASGACLQTLKGHSRFVSSVAFSHDSLRLASASGDCTIKIWDASSGACLETLAYHSDSIRSLAFSHDSTHLVSASDDHTVRIWEISSGLCLRTLVDHSSTVSSVAFSHDAIQLVSASHDCKINIWDTESGTCLRTLRGHKDFINSVTFSHDSTRLASASDDRTIRIWDAHSGVCLQIINARGQGIVNSVAFSHNSTQLVSASSDRILTIWDASMGAYLQTLKGHSGSINSVAFSRDSSRLTSASHDGTVRIWDTSASTSPRTLDNNHSDVVSAVAFSHDSSWFASASYDRTVKIWDTSNGVCLHTLNIGHGETVDRLTFSDHSSEILLESGRRRVGIWRQQQTDHNGPKLWVQQTGSNLRQIRWENICKDWKAKRTGQISSTADETQINDATVGLSGEWITYNSKNLLWLPPEYRPSCSAVSGGMIGIGAGSGEVWLFDIETTAVESNNGF